MAAESDLYTCATDLATCSVCLELFNTPKSLPCLHTFCLKCIESYCRGKDAGDEAACPVCRQKFRIPAGGVRNLLDNFVLRSLVDAKHTSRMKPHNPTPMKRSSQLGSIQTRGGFRCEKHNDEWVGLCFDCQRNVCLKCLIEGDHQQHRCENVNTVAEEGLKKLETKLEAVRERIAGARKTISHLDEEKSRLLVRMEIVRQKIVTRGEEWKQQIDEQVNELTLQVQSLTSQTCKEIESLREKAELQLVRFETFSAHCCELKAKGKSGDTTRAANDLYMKANKLLDDTVSDCNVPSVTFFPGNLDEFCSHRKMSNIIGVVKSVRIPSRQESDEEDDEEEDGYYVDNVLPKASNAAVLHSSGADRNKQLGRAAGDISSSTWSIVNHRSPAASSPSPTSPRYSPASGMSASSPNRFSAPITGRPVDASAVSAPPCPPLPRRNAVRLSAEHQLPPPPPLSATKARVRHN